MELLNIPPIFAACAAVRNAQLGGSFWVTRGCDLVLEGYPRSANTYLNRIVRAATGGKLHIANHVHRPQQVRMAVRYGIPCFVLFRHPLDCIASYMVREPGLDIAANLRRYIAFAETTFELYPDSALHILMFEDVVAEPGRICGAILDAIGQPTKITQALIDEATRDTRKEKTRSSLPNPEKERLKQQHFDAIRSLPDYPRAVALFEHAATLKWSC